MFPSFCAEQKEETDPDHLALKPVKGQIKIRLLYSMLRKDGERNSFAFLNEPRLKNKTDTRGDEHKHSAARAPLCLEELLGHYSLDLGTVS